MKKITLYLFAIVMLSACNNETPVTNEDDTETTADSAKVESTNDIEKISCPEDSKFNDLAQFIAGKEGSATSYLKEMEADQTWISFQNSLDLLWKKTNAKLPTIKEWSAQELSDINTDGGTLFYPFSGADFLHADLFFPDHDNIAMIALEPIGTFPDMEQMKEDGTRSVYLNRLRKSMHAILGMSFFRTIAMADDFKSELDGTLHVLMHFMARTDHTVMYQEKVAILPNGELTTDMSNLADSTYIGNRYYFKKNGQEKVRTLTYFAVNMQNSPYVSRGGLVAKGLNTRTDLVAYFKGLNIKSTYLKSASYLMHRPTFSIIRNLILDESEHVLEDDSGIPVQYFDESKWDLTFYGNYSSPISLFAERHQEDLKEIYQKKEKTVKPLPFGIGYQYRNGTSNLMRATKK